MRGVVGVDLASSTSGKSFVDSSLSASIGVRCWLLLFSPVLHDPGPTYALFSGSSNVNLLHPIRPGNVAAIADYIRAGGDLYIQDTHGNPPLHVVRLRVLFARDADVLVARGLSRLETITSKTLRDRRLCRGINTSSFKRKAILYCTVCV